jgi:glucose uptake protein GlcU
MIALAASFYYVMHFPVNSYINLAVMGLFVIGLVWSLTAFKFSPGENKSIKDYFSEGFKTFIVATLLIVVYTVVFNKMNPQILDERLKENERLAALQGDHTPMDIENNTKQIRNNFTSMTIATTTIPYLILGSVVSLIAGVAFSQSNKQ